MAPNSSNSSNLDQLALKGLLYKTDAKLTVRYLRYVEVFVFRELPGALKLDPARGLLRNPSIPRQLLDPPLSSTLQSRMYHGRSERLEA